MLIADIVLHTTDQRNLPDVAKRASILTWVASLAVFFGAVTFFALQESDVTLIETAVRDDSIYVGASAIDSTVQFDYGAGPVDFNIKSSGVALSSVAECEAFVNLKCIDETGIVFRRRMGDASNTMRVQSYSGLVIISFNSTVSTKTIEAHMAMCDPDNFYYTQGHSIDGGGRTHILDTDQTDILTTTAIINSMVDTMGPTACLDVVPISGKYYNTVTRRQGAVEIIVLALALASFTFGCFVFFGRLSHIIISGRKNRVYAVTDEEAGPEASGGASSVEKVKASMRRQGSTVGEFGL